MTGLDRQLTTDTGLESVDLAVSVPMLAKPVIDGDLLVCQKQLEIENTITGLMAIGMSRWDAMVSMIDGNLATQADFTCLDGIPGDMLSICDYRDVDKTIRALDNIAAFGDERISNRCLNVWLEGVTLDARLDLRNRNWLTELPNGLKVNSHVLLGNCKYLRSLPKGFTVACGGLTLAGCSSLESLPDDISVDIYIDLKDCTSLKSLPSGLAVNGYLEVYGCLSLTSLPNGLRVGGNLNISWCSGLTSLADIDDLVVGGALYIKTCKNLKSIPSNLNVNRLQINNCLAWDGVIAKDAKIFSRIHTDTYPNGLTLGEWHKRAAVTGRLFW